MKPQKKKKSDKKKKKPMPTKPWVDPIFLEMQKDNDRKKAERQELLKDEAVPYLHDTDEAYCERYLLCLEFYITCALHCKELLKKEGLTAVQKARILDDIDAWEEEAHGVLESTHSMLDESDEEKPAIRDFLEKMSGWCVKAGWAPHPMFAEKFEWAEPIREYALVRELREMREKATNG